MKIPIAKPDIGKDEIEAVTATMRSGWVTQGKRVEEFEDSFAKYCGVTHGVAANTGTAALHLALASLDIKEGDEVITTPLSCVATVNPVVYLNARPVFTDVDPTTLNIDPTKIEKKITEKTKAIVLVHLFGHPADLDPLREIAEKHGLFLVEDAAHAHGARYKGKRVGSFGDVSCFSFYIDKNITTVEGGMALTNDSKLAEKMRVLRSFGMHRQKKFYHTALGYNYKMSDVHAAVGLVQLWKLDGYVAKRRENIEHLRSRLAHSSVRLPSEQDYAYSVYYVCHIVTESPSKRKRMVEYLERKGIETRSLVSFIPEQPPYQKYGIDVNELKTARSAHRRGFYVSNSPLLSEDELDYLASALSKSVREIEKQN